MEEKKISVKFGSGVKFDLVARQLEATRANNQKAARHALEDVIKKNRLGYTYGSQKELLADFLRFNEVYRYIAQPGEVIQVRAALRWLTECIIDDIKRKSETLSDKAFHLYIDTYSNSIGYEAMYSQESSLEEVLEYIVHVYGIYNFELPEFIAAQYEQEEQPEIEPEINIFNGMPLDRVRKYFSLLSVMTNNNGDTFMDLDQVELFIQRAFLGKDYNPKAQIRKGDRDGKYIQKLFLEYWDNCNQGMTFISQGGNNQKDYLRLLTDNIEGFNFKSLSSNFHKAKGARRQTPYVNIAWK